VTVILPVHNEAAHLDACLESLLAQQGVDFAIIVVDDGSIDETPAILRSFQARDPRITVVSQPQSGPGAARNAAVKLATGDILAFCDGDMTFAPGYLAALVAPIVREEAVGTFSKEEYVANWANVWARCWNLNDGITTNKRHPEDWPDQHEVFRAIRRDAFMKANGFTVQGSGDDSTLAKKLEVLAQVAPGAVCYHFNPESLREAFTSARWYGRGRRVPATWHNMLINTPVVSLKRSLKRAIHHRLPAFILFKCVVDAGILVGLLEKRFGVSKPTLRRVAARR
jgi:glycosyltransferase involved in cell wall biosynthesis